MEVGWERNEDSMSAEIQIHNPIQILKAGGLYFGIVFGAGFVFGIIRVLWVAPHLGVRNAELLEHPLMLVVIFLTANWVVRNFVRQSSVDSLAIGFIALGLLLLAEVFVALFVQPNRPGDAVSGIAYFAMLALFALMPWLLSTWKTHKARWAAERLSKGQLRTPSSARRRRICRPLLTGFQGRPVPRHLRRG